MFHQGKLDVRCEDKIALLLYNNNNPNKEWHIF